MSAEIRPKFALELDCPSKTVLSRVYARLGEGPHQLRRTKSWGSQRPVDGKDRDHFILTVADDEQRLWSPWLDVEVKPRGEGTHLSGRFGPHPAVWTWFAMTYMGLTLVLLLSLCWAAALVLGRMGAPWTLWVSAGAAAVMGVLWGVSQVGQRWSRTQMVALRGSLEAALSECGEARPSAEVDDPA